MTETGTDRERERERGWKPKDEHKNGIAMGAGTETREVVETRTGTEEVGGEMKKRKKPLRGCRHQVGNGGNIGGKIN